MGLNLKIMPVEDWLKKMLDKEHFMYCETDINDYRQIQPVYFKENFYLLTENGKKKCWQEVKTDEGFIAIEGDIKSFEWDLHEDDVLKTPEKIIIALRNLGKLDPKILTNKQSGLVWRYDWEMKMRRSMRETSLSWNKWHKENEKEFGNG